ncbi:MAG: GMC family oxidoreductase [Planktotalea sp.]|uniref:GMC oxidoreductase n=1 Tax=Planktotalea sp. TaxID=2029877 RepID=UPI003C764F69
MSLAVLDQDWDAVIIGTGMGGGTIGRVLAEGGMRVLFIEKGPSGHRSERQALHGDVFTPEARSLRGFWPKPMRAKVDGHSSTFFAPIGAGVGGSSAFYAATLERPERHDIDDHPHANWPVRFDAFTPWYDQAEAMFHVCGAPDPLSPEPQNALKPAPELDPSDRAIMDDMRARGLHPYRLHSAIRYVDGCLGCLGSKCPRPCKMDGRSAGVEPALASGNAALLDRAEVTAIESSGTKITSLRMLRDGIEHTLATKRVILAGGALGSARLLLASGDGGLANSSGLVGRNLMFHLNEMFALWPRKKIAGAGASKAISLRDLYHQSGDRFGTIQSMGIGAGYGEILHYLRLMLARSAFSRVPLANDLARIPAAIAVKMLGNAKVFVGLLEDYGYPKNRVIHDPEHPGTLSIEYTISPELKARRKAFRKAIRRAFRGQRKLFLSLQPELNFGHPCGTLRFGNDPKTSVLDVNCKAHDLNNLWVVDSSFMPTSFGVNPSLTIAANAIRVGHHLLEEMRP